MKNYLAILLLLLCANAFSATSKWVDENGKVHYSDQPPPSNVEATVLRPISTPSVDENSSDEEPAVDEESSKAPGSVFERLADLKKRQQEEQEAADKAAQEKKVADAKKNNCSNARKNLMSLQNGIRLVELGDDGERSYISDVERQERIAKAQDNIQTFCN